VQACNQLSANGLSALLAFAVRPAVPDSEHNASNWAVRDGLSSRRCDGMKIERILLNSVSI